MVLLASLAGLSLLAGSLAGSSRLHIGSRPRPQLYNLAALLPRRSLGMRPTQRPGQLAALSGEHPAAAARSFLPGTRQVADTRGSPGLRDPDRALAPRSCTTRRASLLPTDDSSGIFRWGASQVALARRARQALIVPKESESQKRHRQRAAMSHAHSRARTQPTHE